MIRNYTAYDHREIWLVETWLIIIIWCRLIGQNEGLQVVAARGSSSFLDGAQVTRPPLPSLRSFLCQSLVDQYSGCICDAQGTLTSCSLPQTMRDVTVATFCSIQHQDPGSGVLWKFWKCAKEKPERRQGAASVLKCNDPADMETLNGLILKKASSLFVENSS